MKVCCVFLMTENYIKKYPFYCKNSVESFKKWHPDIEVIILDDEKLKNYDPKTPYGLVRFLFIRDIFKQGYTKVISIGADTLTCGRFDEMLEDNDSPLICSLDFKSKFPQEMYPDEMKPLFSPQHGVFEWPTINAEIVCVNNVHIIDDLERITRNQNSHCAEQGALNYMYTKNPGSVRIVDFPYEFSRVVYNNRAKGILGSNCIKKGKLFFGIDGPQVGEFSPMFVWKPIGNRLFNQDGKHVKMFHFCIQDDANPITEWFNPETVQFFVEHCACDWSLPFKVVS